MCCPGPCPSLLLHGCSLNVACQLGCLDNWVNMRRVNTHWRFDFLNSLSLCLCSMSSLIHSHMLSLPAVSLSLRMCVCERTLVCALECVSVDVCVCVLWSLAEKIVTVWICRQIPFNSDVRFVVGIINANSSHTVKLNIMSGLGSKSQIHPEKCGYIGYWAIQAGLLSPLTFARHRLSPLAAFTSGAYFLHNGRRW